MKKTILQFLVLSLATTFAFAGDVDLKKSVVKWEGKKVLVDSKHYGRLFLKSAKVLKDKKGNLASGELVVDMNSLTVDDLQGKMANNFLGHMKSGDFFTVSKFPTATLKISKVDAKHIHGTMTIKGASKTVKIPYKKSGNTYTGKYVFDRTDFGLKYGSGKFFTGLGDKVIADEVSLDYSLTLK